MKNLSLIILTVFILAGCATAGGRNYQSDIHALNNKVRNLQSQLAAKNQHIAGLQDQLRACQSGGAQDADLYNQINGLQSQLDQAMRDKEDAESRLYQALDKLASKSSSGGYSKSSDKSYVK